MGEETEAYRETRLACISYQTPCRYSAHHCKGLTHVDDLATRAECQPHPSSNQVSHALTAFLENLWCPVKFPMHLIGMMKFYGVEPIVVLDGSSLPGKAGTNQARREKRQSLLAKGKEVRTQHFPVQTNAAKPSDEARLEGTSLGISTSSASELLISCLLSSPLLPSPPLSSPVLSCPLLSSPLLSSFAASCRGYCR